MVPHRGRPGEAVARWGATTYDMLVAEAEARVPGVVMRETLMLYRGAPDRSLPLPASAAAVGEVRAADRDELPPGYAHGLRFAVPLVEMPEYLPYLHEQVLTAGATQVVRRVTRLDDVLDLKPDVIVNAAGMGAGALADDDSVYRCEGRSFGSPTLA